MSVPLAFAGVIMIWSTTPLAIKWSALGTGFIFAVAARMAIGLVLSLLLSVALRKQLPWHREAIYTYVMAGLGIFATMGLSYWGAQYIPSGLISVIFGLTPLMTAVLAALWLGERSFTPARVTGMLLGMLGLLVIFGGDHLQGEHVTAGILAVVLAVFCQSASAVWMKRVGTSLPALTVTTGSLLFAVPMFVLVWLLLGASLPHEAQPVAMGAIVYLGVVGSVLGFVLYFYLLKRIEVSRTALITLVTPVLALLLGMLLNGEHISMAVWLGTTMILAGLALYQWGHLLGRRAVVSN